MGQSNFTPKHRKASPGRSLNPRQKILNMYDHDWEKYRIKYLALNQKCYSCGDKSTVVDHLVPHQGDEKLFRKTDNHIPLCQICHNKVTALFDRRHRAGINVNPKIQWMNANRFNRGLTFRVKVLPSYP